MTSQYNEENKFVLRNLPLSEQVRTQILQWIQSGSLALEEKVIPSEMEIVEILNTIRATVREEFAQLERDRVIIRKQGSRTYINPTVRHLTSTFNELLDPETFIISQGYNYLVSFFNTEKTNVTVEDALALSVSPDSEAYRVSILYIVDQSPVLWLMAVIPPDPLMSESPINTKHIPLSSLVWRITGTRTSHSLASIDTVNADNETSQKLSIEYGKALIHVQEIHLSDFGREVFLSYQYLIPRIFNLQMLRNTYSISERFSVW